MSNTVVVAGGTGALGVAVTAEFLRAGWRVVVPGRTEESLARLGTDPALNPVIADQLRDLRRQRRTALSATEGRDVRALCQRVLDDRASDKPVPTQHQNPHNRPT